MHTWINKWVHSQASRESGRIRTWDRISVQAHQEAPWQLSHLARRWLSALMTPIPWAHFSNHEGCSFSHKVQKCRGCLWFGSCLYPQFSVWHVVGTYCIFLPLMNEWITAQGGKVLHVLILPTTVVGQWSGISNFYWNWCSWCLWMN